MIVLYSDPTTNMVFETNATYDYSFYYKQDNNIKPEPKTHNDVYYHRMQQREPIAEPNLNRNNKCEAYYEFVYSPMLPKSTPPVNETNENSVLYYISKWFCCYTG
jgi:hypothetical protein